MNTPSFHLEALAREQQEMLRQLGAVATQEGFRAYAG